MTCVVHYGGMTPQHNNNLGGGGEGVGGYQIITLIPCSYEQSSTLIGYLLIGYQPISCEYRTCATKQLMETDPVIRNWRSVVEFFIKWTLVSVVPL